jgi:hypothetical protein
VKFANQIATGNLAARIADIRPTNETLDRIDPKGNYTPKNCRWADATIQANNKNKKPMGKITAAKLAA